MTVDPMVLFRSVLLMIIFILPGFLLRKFKLADGGLAKGLSTIVLYVAQPAMLVILFVRPYDAEIMRNSAWVLGFGFVAHIVFYLILTHMFGNAPDKLKRVYRYAAVFSNAGYMGLPLVTSVLGDEAGIYVSMYIVTFNLFSWSLGCLIYSGDKKYISAKKILINPATIPIFIGLLFFLLPIDGYIPEVVTTALTTLKTTVSPLAMILIGIRLAEVDFKTAFKDKYLPLSLGMRLIVLPVIIWGIMKLVTLTGVQIGPMTAAVVLICASTPPSTATSMFAEKFDGDTAAASKTVSIGTLLSVATMPLIALLLKV